MPFKSKAQEGYLWAHDPKVAEEFAKKTPKGAKLPEHAASDESKRARQDMIERRKRMAG